MKQPGRRKYSMSIDGMLHLTLDFLNAFTIGRWLRSLPTHSFHQEEKYRISMDGIKQQPLPYPFLLPST